jgi:hypothetical protein
MSSGSKSGGRAASAIRARISGEVLISSCSQQRKALKTPPT